ncbi:MAG: glycosyltransferase family 4 protein, partial [Alphaproteobacteria bacterium]|nr:glycosyltransferase family 4 protein [Alphaproteobacteria bacterium]
GGAQRVFTHLANAWAAEGRPISLVTLSAPGSDFFRLAPEIRRISIDGLAPSKGPLAAVTANLRRLKALRRAFKACGAPRVLAFTGAMNVLTVLATRGLGLEVTISERNDPARQSLGRAWDLLRRRTYPMADRVTANSRGAIATLERFVPAEKLAFVPNPVVQDRSSARADLAGPTILNVGRLAPQKAQDVLIDAFAAVAADHLGWQLAIVGTGESEAALRRQAGDLGIADRVHFVGQVADPNPYYLAAEVFALPSRFEGTPNVLLEAMSAGMPCIVSDASGGPLEYVDDGKTGLVVPADDWQALVGALRRLIENPDLRQALGEAARQRLRGHGAEAVLEAWTEALGLDPLPAGRLSAEADARG